jgi:hypothetical protein
MAEQVEISSLDLRYENCRMKSKHAERQLLESILDSGIRDALQGVETKQGSRILLDGFKRYRCAQKLNIGIVPYHSLGADEALGIIELLRIANAKSLCILEQAKLIDELKSVHKMSNSEIAAHLEKSKAWVSVRTGIIAEMSESVMKKIFNGQFPVYAYMYTLRQFIRINRISKADVDEFVEAVSGKNLSIRDIETLAHGYFKGCEDFRQQVKDGHIPWALRRLKDRSANPTDCTPIERSMLNDLQIVQKYMQRVICRSRDERYQCNVFFAQAHLISGGILRQLGIFSKAVKEFHDKCGQASSDLSAS